MPVPEVLRQSALRVFYKPVRLGQVIDQVAGHVRVREEAQTSALIGGRFTLEAHNLELQDRQTGRTIRLTEKEHHILKRLIAANGGTVTRRALLDTVWGYNEQVETHTLETHIYRLRQKIEADPSAPTLLLTSAQGYALAP
jgi:DNA-binding response OmpR family regulator